MAYNPFKEDPQVFQHEQYIELDLLKLLLRQGFGSLLDSACGIGCWGFLLRMNQNESYIVGLEVNPEYIKNLYPLGIYDELVHWDLREIPLPFDDKSFDVVLSCETLEHLPKIDGLTLLMEYERIARKLVLCTTPYQQRNMCNQKRAFQEMNHASSWTDGDFKKLGYTTQVYYALPRTLQPFQKLRRLVLGLPQVSQATIVAAKPMR